MSSINFNNDTHIVCCPIGNTGHLRPIISLITNIIHINPHVLITVFVLKTLVVTINDEVTRSGCTDVTRIRVIGVSNINFDHGADHVFFGKAVEEISEHVPKAYQTIVEGGIVTCTATGKTYDYSTIAPPTLALVGALAPVVGKAVKRITPDVKLLVVSTFPASFFIRFSGPKDLGGMGQWEEDIKERMAKDPTVSFTDAAKSFILPTGQEFLDHEGVKMYDYELLPQLDASDSDVIQTRLDAIRHVNVVADGVILPITESWEPNTSRLTRERYEGELGKKLFFVGQHFQSKHLSQRPADDPTTVARYPKTFEFLDSQKPQSVWLIAFGSVYYPYARPEQLYAVMRTLLKRHTPFILSRSGMQVEKSPPIPQALLEEVEKSRLGLIVDYVPQEVVLNHPNIGAFLTHGGMNSMQETVQAGVIPIFWPFTHDQPFNAAYLSHKLDCAFELIQVRVGLGAQPPYRGGTVIGTEAAVSAEVEQVIEELRGEVGARKRRNFDTLRATFLKELGEGGDVHKALSDIVALATYLLK